ncbi:hypothetical protein FK481_0071 [Listeria phage LP-010]|uniref:Uncharacterized protein n=4 Tax=Homburgvirus TaxID=1921125 RepID=A0A6C0R0T4_9CAUD|nr:hypothetical protein FK481_0071 [Listeria phage LP-010]QDK04695.1 hypothetical protein FK482_0073 [Listeria phage LP-013]QDK04804.1 hypothetical protein FK484_0071 [Listeria phage LP-031]QHZ59416.1 hypothetical protein FK483_0073 [Listeria phage LP-018]
MVTNMFVVWFAIISYFFGSIVTIFTGVCLIRIEKKVADGVKEILSGLLLAGMSWLFIVIFL